MGNDKRVENKNFDPIIEILPMNLALQTVSFHINIALAPKVAMKVWLPVVNLGYGFSIRLDFIRADNLFQGYRGKQSTRVRRQRLKSNDVRGISSCKADLYPIDVTRSCTRAKGDEPEGHGPFDYAIGYTMDLKQGLYASLNIAGFDFNSGWIGDRMGTGYNGFYWGKKNLVARCWDCGKQGCVTGIINDLLSDIAVELTKSAQKHFFSQLKESEHVSKNRINSLDKPMKGEEVPTSDADVVCVAHDKSELARRGADDDEEEEEEEMRKEEEQIALDEAEQEKEDREFDAKVCETRGNTGWKRDLGNSLFGLPRFNNEMGIEW